MQSSLNETPALQPLGSCLPVSPSEISPSLALSHPLHESPLLPSPASETAASPLAPWLLCKLPSHPSLEFDPETRKTQPRGLVVFSQGEHYGRGLPRRHGQTRKAHNFCYSKPESNVENNTFSLSLKKKEKRGEKKEMLSM